VDTGQDRTPSKEKLRTQRILGKLLKESELQQGSRGVGKKVELPDVTPLSELGVTKKQSSTFQQIASIYPSKAQLQTL